MLSPTPDRCPPLLRDAAAIRVSTVPGRHGYVDRCLAGATGVEHLPDPTGSTSGADPWQPSPVLRPEWIDAHAAEIDLVHLHFGFEHRTPEQLQTWTDTLARQQIALVLTVHDLDNPHLADQRGHHRSLTILTRAAAAVLTLTQGAAQELERSYGVEATVVAHPHQFDLGLVGRRIRPRSNRSGRIGVNLRSLRENVDARAALALLQHAPPTAQVVVRVSHAALADGGPVGALVREGVSKGQWEVDAVPGHTSEHDLWEFLSGIDALLLPYRWGTHSGWVESCWDVGTTVVAPPVGHYTEQHPVTELALDADEATIYRVLNELHPSGGATADDRRVEQFRVATSHAQIYRSVLR